VVLALIGNDTDGDDDGRRYGAHSERAPARSRESAPCERLVEDGAIPGKLCAVRDPQLREQFPELRVVAVVGRSQGRPPVSFSRRRAFPRS